MRVVDPAVAIIENCRVKCKFKVSSYYINIKMVPSQRCEVPVSISIPNFKICSSQL